MKSVSSKPPSALQGSRRTCMVCKSHYSENSHNGSQQIITRRATLAVASLLIPTITSSVSNPISHAEEQDPSSLDSLTMITDRVFIDFGLCPEGVRNNRTLGDKSILCSDPEPMGRIIIGLYGNAAPGTTSNFKELISSKSLEGTCLSKILSGQWIVAGQQGSHRSGLLEPPSSIKSNPDILSSRSFQLRHLRAGTVSLNLSYNEDEEYIRFKKDYRPLSFLITTGPAPAPSLDGENIVFGIVEEGMDVISDISTKVPVFLPNENLRAYNSLANFIGDDRAARTKAKWGKPLKAVLISDTGLL